MLCDPTQAVIRATSVPNTNLAFAVEPVVHVAPIPSVDVAVQCIVGRYYCATAACCLWSVTLRLNKVDTPSWLYKPVS
jgi:hypothetical protein